MFGNIKTYESLEILYTASCITAVPLLTLQTTANLFEPTTLLSTLAQCTPGEGKIILGLAGVFILRGGVLVAQRSLHVTDAFNPMPKTQIMYRLLTDKPRPDTLSVAFKDFTSRANRADLYPQVGERPSINECRGWLQAGQETIQQSGIDPAIIGPALDAIQYIAN